MVERREGGKDLALHHIVGGGSSYKKNISKEKKIKG